MKIHSLLFLAIWFYAFSAQITEKRNTDLNPKKVDSQEIQAILDSAGMKGHILIHDLNKDTYFSNDHARAEQAFIPASTFKIPNTLMALEHGIVEDENTIMKWDDRERSISNWNQDLTLKQAFHFSCVPCYQEIARNAGSEKMKEFVQKIGYGNMDIDDENIDEFWLLGNSRISSYEQIDFLRRFQASELAISKRTEKIAKELMISDKGGDYTVLSKTGWSSNGVWWYVGYVEKGDEVYFFATNLEEADNVSPNVRKQVTTEALAALGIKKDLRP